MSGLILPGSPINLSEHRSRSQREIDGLRTLSESLAVQNRKLFALLTALTIRYGPVISIAPDALDGILDPAGKNDHFCGFAVSRETGEVTIYTEEMAPVIMAALRAEVMRKNAEANGQPPLGEEREQPPFAVPGTKLYEVRDEVLRKQSEELLGEKPEEER